MRLDLTPVRTVACFAKAPRTRGLGVVLLALGCGPRARPDVPEGPRPPAVVAPGSGTGSPGTKFMVGEMCPQAGAGRPAVIPVAQNGVVWTDDAATLSDAITRGKVSRFSVIGYDGARAGVFAVVGSAEVEIPQEIAVGSYLGAAPCTRDVGSGQRAEDPGCNSAARGCGLALGYVDNNFDEEALPEWRTGKVCLVGSSLVADIDGDGASEHFPIASFLDGVRAPSDEILAEAAQGAGCTGSFSLYGLAVASGAEPGGRVDPKYVVTLDVLGIADLDRDGRHELVVAFRYPENRSIVIYRASERASRMEAVAESVAWH
jgi:hypothetical protein